MPSFNHGETGHQAMEDFLLFFRFVFTGKVNRWRFTSKYIASCHFEKRKQVSYGFQQIVFIISGNTSTFNQQGYFEMDSRVFDKGWTFKCISSLFSKRIG